MKVLLNDSFATIIVDKRVENGQVKFYELKLGALSITLKPTEAKTLLASLKQGVE